jgi:hypothetical protein
MLATLGLILIAWYGYQYARIGGLTIDRSDEFIQGAAAQIDTMTPAQLLEVWGHEVIEEGLGEPHQPYWVTAKEKVSEYFWWMKIAAAAVVAGIAVAGMTMLVGRR